MTLLLFIFSFVLRLISVNQSFWLDEGASLVLARLPISTFFTAIQNDFHPPLFYLLLHFWIPLAGRSEFLLRLPNILIGAATVPALYLLLKATKINRHLPLFAALLLALNPLHIYYSQELRMYSLNVLLAVLSWYFLIKKDFKLFFLVTLANLYTFYGAIFNLAAQWVYIFWPKQKKEIKPFLITNVLLFIGFIPWLPTFLNQLQGGGYLVKTLAGWSALSGTLSLKSIGLIFAKFVLGRITIANKISYLIFLIAIINYFIFSVYLSLTRTKSKHFLLWFFVPLIIGTVASLVSPMLGYWRFIYILPPFLTLLALGITSLPQKIAYINLAAVSVIFLIGNLIFWTTPSFQREDWRAAATLINQPDSITILNFPDVFAPLKYYAPDVFFYPDESKLGQFRQDLDITLPALLSKRTHVFVFDYLSDLTDPKRRILSWLKEAGLILKTTHNINGVGFIYEFTAP